MTRPAPSGEAARQPVASGATTGLLRMFSSSVGDQVSWLIPSALILLLAGVWLRGRLPRTDLRRAAYLVWGGWLVVTMLVFSLMAGIFHEYYTVALAPAIAALVGMGAVEAWERRDSAVATIALAAAIAAAATWGFILLSRTTAYGDWLRVSVLAVGMAAALLVLAVRWMHPPRGAARRRRGARREPRRPGRLHALDDGPGAHRLDRDRRALPASGDAGGRPRRRCRWWTRRRWRWHGWPARRVDPQHRRRRGSLAGRRPVHLGRCGRRLADRGRTPARHGSAGHGDRRLQRVGPEPDPRAVPAARRRPARSTTSPLVEGDSATRTVGAAPPPRSPHGCSRTSPR